MLFVGLVLCARYPTDTASWETPAVISKWPTDTEPWGPPPTEFPTDNGQMATTAIVGITVAAFAALAIIVVCILFFMKGRNKARLDKKLDNEPTPECNNYGDATRSPLL